MAKSRGTKLSMPRGLLWAVVLLFFGALIGALIQSACEQKQSEAAPAAPQSVQPNGARPPQAASGSIKKPSPVAPTAIVPTPERTAAKQSTQPRVALIIDDLGQVDPALTSRLGALNIPMTVAVLPFLPHTRDSAHIARSSGMEIILHMPMEPIGYPGPGRNPGPGAVLFDQSEAEVRERVASAMKDVPFAVGLNNHMGSRITPDRVRMAWILEEVKKTRWYFLDSRTEKDTVALEVARELGIPALERKVFLDDSPDPAEMSHQWERAMAIAKQDGWVVIIGHIHVGTLEFLEKAVPAARREVVFVKAPEMAR